MHLISPLISGVRNAENGSARIVRRGTTTRATLYSSFEGDSFPSGSLDTDSDVILDSYGRAEVYVEEVCDVTVYDADGAQQIVFTAGYSSAAIEVRSPSFTGNNYDGSGSGVSRPITLQAILDLWSTTQGDTDWEMAAAAAAIIVVTNEPYGAVGDGTTDDTVAIQAALTAGGSTGRIVYFPGGTYRVTAQLTIQPDSTLMGAGAQLQMTHATNALLSAGTCLIAGLDLLSTGTGTLVEATGNATLERCTVSGRGKLVTAELTITLRDCTLTAEDYPDGEEFIELLNANAEAHVYGCNLRAPTGAYTPASGAMVLGNNLYFEGCTFFAANTTSGTFSYIAFDDTELMGSVRGCVFGDANGATVTALTLGAYVFGSFFHESDSIFGDSITFYSYTASGSTAGVHLRTRDKLVKVVNDNGATVAIPTDQYGIVIVKSTNTAAVMTGTLPPTGAHGEVYFYHSGAGGTARPTTNFFGTSNATTTSTSLHMWQYTCAIVNATLRMLVAIDGRACGTGV